MAAGFSEYAGIPLPIDGEQMVIEPSYGFSEVFNKPRQASENEEESYPGYTVRNEFWSTRWRCLIVVFRAPDGKIRHGKIPGMHHIAYDLHTMGCSVAWGVEQESRALQLLGTMLPHHQFKYYLLTGMFMERSPRSGLTYIFRKLRPTVVLDARDVTSKADTRILCTLCMHPIGYYAGSWAGAMCPTDDVIAHLSLMRGDEPMFWRRSNQHHPERAEAGL